MLKGINLSLILDLKQLKKNLISVKFKIFTIVLLFSFFLKDPVGALVTHSLRTLLQTALQT